MTMNKDLTKKRISSRHLNMILCLLLAATTLTVYWQVHGYDFINYDDDVYVYNNPHINNGLTPDNIIWAFTTTEVSYWHPLTWISHMLDCQLFGLNPGWHHLVNLLFHMANTLLLFFLLKKMTGCTWESVIIAGLFALHPMHVQSVAWISERKDVLSTFFWLVTMWSYLRYVKHPAIISYFFVVLFFSMGLMSKPMVVTLPFVLLLMDYWPLNRLNFQSSNKNNQENPIFRLILEKVPLFITLLLSCFVTFYSQIHVGAVKSLDAIPIGARLANAIVSYVAYIQKLIYPSNLAVLYPHLGMPPLWKISLSCLLLICLSLLAVMNTMKRPYLIVGWLWYLGTLVPVIGLLQVGIQSMADRYTYIPSIGLFIVVVFGLAELLTKFRVKKIFISISTIAVLLTYMTAARTQAGYWKNSNTLFEHALQVTSGNYTIHFNMGNTLVSQGRPEEAIHHYLEAVKINPGYLEARFNLGITLYNTGHTGDAIKQYLRVISIKPDFVEAYNYLGMAFLKVKNIDKAIVCFQKALKIDPNYLSANNNLKNALMLKQQYQSEKKFESNG